MKKIVLALAGAAILAGCATQDPDVKPIVTQTVDVPLAVHCKPDLGPEPSYPDSKDALAASVKYPGALPRLLRDPSDPAALREEMDNVGTQVKLLLAGRLMRIQRDKEKSAALAACE